jgi:hypothetical protein
LGAVQVQGQHYRPGTQARQRDPEGLPAGACGAVPVRGMLLPAAMTRHRRESDMWKPNKSRAEQHFAAAQKKDDKLIKQKEKTQRERDDRMARLRDLRLAKEAAEQQASATPAPAAPAEKAESAAEAPETAEELTARLPKVHPHQS